MTWLSHDQPPLILLPVSRINLYASNFLKQPAGNYSSGNIINN